VLAEIELDRCDEPFVLPPWVSAEVTEDLRYRSEGIALGLWRTHSAAPPSADAGLFRMLARHGPSFGDAGNV